MTENKTLLKPSCQVAIAAGATGELIEKVAAQMVAEKTVRIDKAEELLPGMKNDD